MSTIRKYKSPILNLIILIRPEQWIKNGFLFVGAIFSLTLFQVDVFLNVLAGFGIFCAAASGIYIFNDIFDRKSDRLDERKSKRPLASGAISLSIAWILCVSIILVSLIAAFFLDLLFFGYVAGYIVLNIAYTLLLKHLVILDVMSIAGGFVIRVVAGTVLAGVKVSNWLFICSVTLSLFLGFGKRRQELVKAEREQREQKPPGNGNKRPVLSQYSISFLDQMIAVATASTLISYIMYTVAESTVERFGGRCLICTVPMVLYGIYRYLYLLHERNTGGDPAKTILKDVPMLVTGILWIGYVLIALY
jgi:4-hydroxybenzoate polyprenyltransferase